MFQYLSNSQGRASTSLASRLTCARAASKTSAGFLLGRLRRRYAKPGYSSATRYSYSACESSLRGVHRPTVGGSNVGENPYTRTNFRARTPSKVDSQALAEYLAALEYPGFAYLR